MTQELLWIDAKCESLLWKNIDRRAPGRQQVRDWYEQNLKGRWDVLCNEGQSPNFETHWTALTEGGKGRDLLFYESAEIFCNAYRIEVSASVRKQR